MAKATRTPLISGNWKMHHNHFEAISTVQKLAYLLHKDDYEVVDVSVHPPFTKMRRCSTVSTVTVAFDRSTSGRVGRVSRPISPCTQRPSLFSDTKSKFVASPGSFCPITPIRSSASHTATHALARLHI